jgi:protein SCO1/2
LLTWWRFRPHDARPPRRISWPLVARLVPAAALGAAVIVGGALVAQIYLPSTRSAATSETLAGGTSRPAIGGPFTLQGENGATVTDRDFRGRWMLVYFGYTFCPDVCPTTLADMATALAELGPLAARIQPIFISVDPARDTPAVAAAYARSFDSRILGLSGSAAEIARVAGAYKVYYSVHRTGDGPGDYLLDHTAFLYVMRPDGSFAGVLDGRDGPRLAAALHRFLDNS